MFKSYLLKHIKSTLIQLIKNANYFLNEFSHLNEHISNFGAVSTQVRVTLWKEDFLYKNKDRQYPVKLMRPEDS